ncbi:MAG TPA: glycosyltransferase [Candidatus Aquilonibacter sp.]|nr:glycosyltransferase [Candidatus Aquilonibacter sp.]
MKICLVTTFPPSQGGLSEYGLHIAQELTRNPFLSVTVLADRISTGEPELEGFSVVRCWSFDDPRTVFRLLKMLRELKPDVVWFNLLFSTFGRNPFNAFLGLLTPLLARMSGCYTHVTLHHLMDTVDLKDAGVRHARAYRWAGALATRMLLMSNSVSVLMPGYRKILHEKYGRDNVHLRSHGILTTRPEYPDFARRGNPEHRILAFGKWGTYKRLELMLESFEIISRVLPHARLVIAGGDHPQAAGYVNSVRDKCAGNPNIEFTGYVPEEALPALFQSATVAVMPYSSSTGCSGVAHLACAYGVPIVCADLVDFRQMADGEEIAIEFYIPGSAQDLASCLVRFLMNPARQEEMAAQNYFSALRMTMPTIVLKYLRHFELDQRAEILRQVTRFRRLPSWVPSKARLLRRMTRNSAGLAYRPAVHRPAATRSRGKPLLHDDVNGSGKLRSTRLPIDGDGIGNRSVRGIAPDGSLDRSAWRSAASTGGADHSDADERNDGQRLHPAPPLSASHDDEAEDSERQNPAGVDCAPSFPLLRIHPPNGNGRDGKS